MSEQMEIINGSNSNQLTTHLLFADMFKSVEHIERRNPEMSAVW